jgi:NADH-quinone oxidoreductase subunit I
MSNHIYDLEKLLKPASYYATIHPKQYAEEEAARLEKEAKKAALKTAKPAA